MPKPVCMSGQLWGQDLQLLAPALRSWERLDPQLCSPLRPLPPGLLRERPRLLGRLRALSPPRMLRLPTFAPVLPLRPAAGPEGPSPTLRTTYGLQSQWLRNLFSQICFSAGQPETKEGRHLLQEPQQVRGRAGARRWSDRGLGPSLPPWRLPLQRPCCPEPSVFSVTLLLGLVSAGLGGDDQQGCHGLERTPRPPKGAQNDTRLDFSVCRFVPMRAGPKDREQALHPKMIGWLEWVEASGAQWVTPWPRS